MQLIIILLFIVSILTLLAGAVVFFGSKPHERIRSFWFFVATIFASIWTISIAFFFMADSSWSETINWHISWIYISAIFIDVALLGYISWRRKIGRILTLIFLILGVIISAVYIGNPGLMYSGIILSKTGNGLILNLGPFYFIYIGYFCLLIPAVIGSLLYQIFKFRSVQKKGGETVLLVGFAISGICSLIFDIILPFWRWDLSWIGPLAVSATIIAFYYAVLRYRMLNINSVWLKIFSYIVIIASVAIIYMAIFSLIFAALFRGSTPSTEVIILNFIMIVIFLLLMPAMSQIMNNIRQIISNQHHEKGK